MLSKGTIKNLPNNSRFYILLAATLLSILVCCWLRAHIASDQLFYIRTEQVYGLFSVCFVYTALLISPAQKVIGKPDWMRRLLFARRAIGVSAAYFAVLHVTVAIWGQMGGLRGIALLPAVFAWPLVFGGVALAVLLVMAATSFDKVITYMTFTRWKWLHRLVYGAGILIVLHVWVIGTHVAYGGVRIAAAVALGLFFGLESWRMVAAFARRFPEFKPKDYFVTLFICLWALWVVLLLVLPGAAPNYHSSHHDAAEKVHTRE